MVSTSTSGICDESSPFFGQPQVFMWDFLGFDLLLRNSSQEWRSNSVMLCCRCDRYERYQPFGVKIL
ncbi:hypothetical protein FJC99_25525 [Escherichia coli]|nr:hypothetical protein [Escherichia coli]